MSNYEKILGRFANTSFQNNISAKFAESFRPNQLKSKSWLVYEITKFKTDFKKVAVLGSWNSILLYELMTSKAKVESWDFYDIDTDVHHDRDTYFKSNEMVMNYNSFDVDATTIFSNTTLACEYDLIINPSCEHMIDIPAVKGPMYALTSNNYEGVEGHINTIEHETDLAVKNGVNNILYKGSLKMPNYIRYCVVGYAE